MDGQAAKAVFYSGNKSILLNPGIPLSENGQVRHALGKLGERLETTVLEINEQGKEIDRLRVAVAGIFLKLAIITCHHNL